MVHLQRQLPPGIDDDALDLETLARVDAFVAAPGTVHEAVLQVLRAFVARQVVHHLLHPLHLVAMRHQHGIVRLDDHQVVHAQDGQHAAAGPHQAIARAVEIHVAAHDIALLVLGQDFPQGRPGADVAPADGGGHDDGAVRVLHHGMVERNAAAAGKGGRLQAEKIQVAAAVRDGLLARCQQVRFQRAQFAQAGGGAEQEHAAVPQVALVGQEGAGRRQVRLFHEALDLPPVRRSGQGCAGKDIAIARFGGRRQDAKRGQRSRRGQRGRLRNRLVKRGHVAHLVVGRQDQHECLGIVRQQILRGRRHGRRRVAPLWFEHDAQRRHARLAQLFRHHEAVLAAADEQRRHGVQRDIVQVAHALHGILQQRLPRYQRQQLFRQRLARQGPQAAAGAPRQDHWIDVHVGAPGYLTTRNSKGASARRRLRRSRAFAQASGSYCDACRISPDRSTL